MKICSYSPKFKNSIPFILEDNSKEFLKNAPENFNGQIDKKSFFNFCIDSNAIKIVKKIIKNQELNEKIKSNNLSLRLLVSNKKLKTSEKTYIYTKKIKKEIKINEKTLFKLICQYDKKLLFWIKNNQKLSKKIYENLFNSEITKAEMEFCRNKNIDLIKLLLSVHKKNIIVFEDYIDLFNDTELIELINTGLELIIKEEDINLLDSIIKILIQKQYLILHINIELVKKVQVRSLDLFDFLNMDIQNVLLYNKFSQKKHKEKVQKI